MPLQKQENYLAANLYRLCYYLIFGSNTLKIIFFNYAFERCNLSNKILYFTTRSLLTRVIGGGKNLLNIDAEKMYLTPNLSTRLKKLYNTKA